MDSQSALDWLTRLDVAPASTLHLANSCAATLIQERHRLETAGRRGWDQAEEIIDIIDHATSFDIHPSLGYFPMLPDDLNALASTALLGESDNGVGSLAIREGICALGIPVAEFLDAVRALPASRYSPRVARFHRDPSAYRWVSVADTPLPHNPFRLPNLARDEFLTAVARSERAIPVRMKLRSPSDSKRRAIMHWIDRLTPDRLAGWRYLDVDWTSVMGATRYVLGACRHDWTASQVELGIADLEEPLRHAVHATFFDPITIGRQESGRDGSVSNGQHRLLAMRVQGVEKVLVAES